MMPFKLWIDYPHGLYRRSLVCLCALDTGKIVCNSFISVISGITLHNADDIAMYPALAVLRAIFV